MAVASPPPAKAGLFGNLLVVGLVLVIAWQLAHWTWVFFTPAPTIADTSADSSVDLAIAARLFGGSATGGTTGSGSSTGLRLKGVIAPTPGVAASAIFSTGAGKDFSVFLGAEVQKGVKLSEVYPDHVIVSRGGVEMRVDLEAPRSAAASASRPSRAAGFKLNVARSGANSFSLSRKELDEALRDPNQLNYLGQIGVPPGGGVRMEAAPAGSLAQKLGLQPGDMIRKVNGQPVASAGDLARLYQQFASLSAVQAEIQRGSATVQLSYAINP